MALAKRKKRFFDVEIPLIRKETQAQAFEIEELKGRLIKYDLTRILRGKNMTLQAVIEIKDEKAIAIPKEIILMPYYLRRMVRKGTNYVEDSISTDCKDAQIRIKPFLVTRRKVSRAVRKALREKARQEIIEYAKNKKNENIFDEILKNQLQKFLSLKLKKIYPLSTCEIRILKIEKFFENNVAEEETLREKEVVEKKKISESED